MPNAIAKELQTLCDVAVVATGGFEGVFALALLNDVGLTDRLNSGQLLGYESIVDEDNVRELNTRRARPATSIRNPANDVDDGIDFWAIEVDFVVS